MATFYMLPWMPCCKRAANKQDDVINFSTAPNPEQHPVSIGAICFLVYYQKENEYQVHQHQMTLR
jgi:hypothetical protein